jgi:hypothetical protein
MTRRAVLPCCFIVTGILAPAARAQVTDSAAVEQPRNCLLQWGAVPGLPAPALRHTESPGGDVADFFSGRTLFTCGTATMAADSAVSYETRGEVYLVGNVAYQDSVRSLDSQFLTYYEAPDLIVATGDVRLIRQTDNSTLEGPRVEFLRAVSGIDELTIATGRPHMTFYPDGEEPGEPFDVDADRIVFAGEDEARAYGQVVIDRADLNGEADSIRLTRVAEMGWMWGDPWIDAEDVRLEGDTIRFRSEEEELKEIHAIGTGRAVGESFEVISELIDVALLNEEPERVWAYGEGLSRAISGGHDLYGDSLEFAMFESSIDTVFAIGRAIAVSGGEDDPTMDSAGEGVEEPDGETETGDPPAGDSTVVTALDPTAMELPTTDSLVVAVDSVAVDDAAVDSVAIETVDDPDDPARAGAEGGEAPGDEAGEIGPDEAGATQESEEGGGEVAEPEDTGRVKTPQLPLEGDAIWVKGDTLIGVFERPGTTGASEDSTSAPIPAAPNVPSTLAEGALAVVDSASLVDVDPAASDSAPDDPVMERLIVIGDARAFYSQIRDSTANMRHSKNYMIAKRIDVLFTDGDPAEVIGVEAIGVFLDPEPEVGPLVDPLAVPGSTAEDSLGAAVDTVGAPPDTLAVPADSTGVPPDTTGTPPDTTRSAPRSERAGPWPDVTGAAIRTSDRGRHASMPAAVPTRRERWWRG